MSTSNTELPNKELLHRLSYKSSLDTNLKQLSIKDVDISIVKLDVIDYAIKLSEIFEIHKINSFRIKSIQSLLLKYNKYMQRGAKANTVFNDLLGIRLLLKQYPKKIPDYFKVVDLRKGKELDDGYRAMHLYFQKDNFHYQIEIQLWCAEDALFNSWSHIYLYKYKNSDIGKKLRNYYDDGKIKEESDFENYLQRIISGGNAI